MRVVLVSILFTAGCLPPGGAHARESRLGELLRADRAHGESGAASIRFDGASLDRSTLVAAVLARNPDLDAARESWRATTREYPGAVAWSDPMVTYEVAPLSIGSSVPFGQRIQLSQRVPYPGKRQLAGDVALADADAAQADYETLRLELAETTVHAFDDYYVAMRALDVNAHHHEIIQRIQKSATAQYTAGRASQQDPLEAEGELIALDRERLQLETEQQGAIARINRLLRRPSGATLPPPPPTLEVVASGGEEVAVHPKQAAAAARIRARASEVATGERGFYPDFELMASYDSMWSDWQHRFMVGVGIEVPLQRGTRRAAVARARAQEAAATAELTSVGDMLAEERSRAGREVEEARGTIALYEHRALPNARTRIDAALAGFTVGQNTFSAVMMAEHSLRDVELRLEQARADLDRKLATLDRVSGRIAGGGS